MIEILPGSLRLAYRGWRRSLADWRICFVLWGLSFASVLPVGCGIATKLDDAFGRRPALDAWSSSPSLGDLATLGRRQPEVFDALAPIASLVSTAGARSPSALRSPSGLGNAFAVALLLAVPLGAFSTAGILGSAKRRFDSEAPVTISRFGSDAFDWGPLFLALALPVLLLDVASYWAVVVVGGRAMNFLFPEEGTERLSLALDALRFGVWIWVVVIGHRVLDHARIAALFSNRRSMARALSRGARVVLSAPLRSVAVAAWSVLPLFFLLAVWVGIGGAIRGDSTAGLVVLLASHHFLLLVRQGGKLALQLAEVDFQASLAPDWLLR